jgi:hypothetical protein
VTSDHTPPHKAAVARTARSLAALIKSAIENDPKLRFLPVPPSSQPAKRRWNSGEKEAVNRHALPLEKRA